ncbi:MAG: hypothetical protein M1835_005145 [Candelina submexicana]|nr:MAG: hypothetical protein M1835_005145 [Candelina submexicana]
MPSLSKQGVRIHQLHIHRATRRSASYVVQHRRSLFVSPVFLDHDSKLTPPKVKWYEKIIGPDSHGSRIAPDREELETAQLKARISQLEEELRQLQDGGFLPKHDLLAQMSEEQRAKVEKELHEVDLEDAAEDELERGSGGHNTSGSTRNLGRHASPEVAETRVGVTVRAPISSQDQIYLDKLNECLTQASTDIQDPLARKELWRWYLRCKQRIPTFLDSISESVWTVLWDSQYYSSLSKPDRMEHLRVFCEDILAHDRELSGRQKLTYVEALFQKGEQARAVSQWEAEQHVLGWDGDLVGAYWTLGVRMFVSQGEPQRAEETAWTLLDDHSGNDASILIPIIRAWIQLGESSSYQNASALYISFRERSGDRARMEDFDTVSMSFLKAGRKDLALAVFKDMMLAGQRSVVDSTVLYRKALGIVGSLHSTSITSSQINSVSLEAMTVLPRTFQNKFFYGSWIKKLLGMGEVDAAAAVVELMYERGTRPDSKHVNGIIGAWLRSGTAADRTKAETMAWAMIQARMDFAWRRRAQARKGEDIQRVTVGEGEEGVRVPLFIQRIVPPATIETFSILVLYFLRRQKYAQVRHLRNLLEPSEIRPNSYFMNHLIYAELRSRGHQKAWQKYKKMTETIQPDLETFACLWDCMKASVEEPKKMHGMGISGSIGPRQLFREMSTWFSELGSKSQDRVRSDFEKELYEQVIRCFCLSKDLEGTLVSLLAMSRLFGMNPTEDSARMLVLQIARMDSAESTVQRRRRASVNSKKNVAKVTKVLEALVQRQRKALLEKGLDLDDCDAPTKVKEQLNLLSSLLRVVLSQSGADTATINSNVQKVAWEMGVGGVDLGYPSSFSKV